MKRHRGFRLGRRVAMVWRWAFRQRPDHVGRCFRPKHYLRFNSVAGAASRCEPSSPWNFSISALPKASSMTSKFLDWTRQLGRRLHRGRDGGKTYCRLGVPLLEEHDDARDGWGNPPPRGFLAVYVGGKDDEGGGGGGGGVPRRYLVPVIHFNHPLFGELLREAEEEFGFRHPGGITIPCHSAEFERVRTLIVAGSDRRTGVKVRQA